MSAIAAWYEPERCLVGVDCGVSIMVAGTDDSDAELQQGTATKIFAMPMLPAVLTMRGEVGAMCTLFTAALVSGPLEIEALAQNIAKITTETRRTQPPELGIGGAAQAWLHGWSAQRGRMQAYFLDGMDPAADYRVEEAPSTVLAPWDDKFPEPWAPSSGEAMVRAMRLQIARLREEGPDIAAGGTLTLAEIRRDRIDMWTREL